VSFEFASTVVRGDLALPYPGRYEPCRRKPNAVNAVATSMEEAVAGCFQAVATDSTLPPVARLLAFGAGVSEVGDTPYERELIEVFHQPENRMLHDRIGDRALVRLSPVIAAIISDGIEGGQFRRQDPLRAAADVMACFGSLHEVVSAPDDVPDAIGELDLFVLRPLGYDGEVPG